MSKTLLPFLSFFLITNFISAVENLNVKNTIRANASMIQEILQEENRDFFFPRSLRLDLLKNCPQQIPILAQWVYEEWHPYDVSLTKEILIQSFVTRLNENKIPISFVVLKNDIPIGIISLKKETAPEFSDFPENSIWMGSLIVAPEERNQGVDQELLKFGQTIARQFGYEKLYLYISNPAYVNWYLNRGADVIDERPFRNHRITIMEIPLREETLSCPSN
jgi:predicted N-acetyltransferase YhbS